MLDPGLMLEHIPGLPDLMLFWTDDVLVIRVFRWGITRGTLSGQHVLSSIWMIMTGGSFKIVSNWTVLTPGRSTSKLLGLRDCVVLKLNLGRLSCHYTILLTYRTSVLSTHGRINTLPSCKLRWCWCLVTPLLPRVIMLSRFHLIIPQCQIGQDDKC